MIIYLASGGSHDASVSLASIQRTLTLPQPNAAQAFRLLENIESLWRSSPLHAHAPTERLFTYVMPAVLLDQYLLVLEQGTQKALGLCTWARMDRLSERRYLADPTSLGKTDWCSGDRIWLIDWIGSTAVNRLMAQMLKTRALPAEVLRTLRVSPGCTTGRILSFQGAAIDRDVARARLQAYHAEYAEFAASAASAASARQRG